MKIIPRRGRSWPKGDKEGTLKCLRKRKGVRSGNRQGSWKEVILEHAELPGPLWGLSFSKNQVGRQWRVPSRETMWTDIITKKSVWSLSRVERAMSSVTAGRAAGGTVQERRNMASSRVGCRRWRSGLCHGAGVQGISWQTLQGTEMVREKKKRRSVSYTHLTLPTKTHQCRSRWSPYH